MDAAEFEGVLLEYERDLYSFCCYLAGEYAADLFQDTALSAFEMRGRIDSSRNPKSFLFSVAAGKWRNYRRKVGRRMGKAEVLPPPVDNPEMAAQNAFVKEAIWNALSGLNDKFRVPLILHYFEESGLESIAEICGVPMGTIKSRLYKGRALLKAALEKEGIVHGL
ncbi:MAG: RNA polymerase sigma factor [Defluviitaleaceae bacterium]|nr:RNA polymerase sigma factor [Defluviitaleaceae bacterium]